MRLRLIPLLTLALIGCGRVEPPALARLEISASGLEVAIDAQGHGSFRQNSSGNTGRFSLSPAQFAVLRNKIEPYRLSPEAVPGSKMADYALHGFPRCEGQYVTDQGGTSFHWNGPSLDQFYNVDFGCDAQRHEARNNELRAILKSLPVPEPDILA